MVSQYLQTLQNTSYKQDEGSFIADFLRPAKTSNPDQFEEISPVLPPGIKNKIIGISKKELNSLYGTCGYIITSVSKLTKVCKQCIDSAGSTQHMMLVHDILHYFALDVINQIRYFLCIMKFLHFFIVWKLKCDVIYLI